MSEPAPLDPEAVDPQAVDPGAICRIRWNDPDAVRRCYADRRRRPFPDRSGRVLLIAVDHPARGALAVGDRPSAMADRRDLLARVAVALARPGVDGVLAAPDLVEDLLLAGRLDDTVVLGSMNRGGLPGTAFEIDDRFTGYDVAAIERSRLDGGKMLLRIDPGDPGSADALDRCSRAITELAAHRLPAIVEPFWTRRDGGRLVTDLDPDAVIRTAVIAAGLGTTSAYTWLKLPVVEQPGGMERIAAATTLPIVLLGGEVPADASRAEEAYLRWEAALRLPTVRGLVVGRSLLYPPDDDVAAAVDRAAGCLRSAVPHTDVPHTDAPSGAATRTGVTR